MRSSFSTCSRKAITMYKQTCTNLLELSSAKVTEWLSSFDSVITDCDGEWTVGGGAVLPTRGRIAPRKLRYIKICIRMPYFRADICPNTSATEKFAVLLLRREFQCQRVKCVIWRQVDFRMPS